MSHLQKTFIAKTKSRMHQPAQNLSHGQLVRVANHVALIGPRGSKKNPQKRQRGGLYPYWVHYDAAPSHLQFTLKR